MSQKKSFLLDMNEICSEHKDCRLCNANEYCHFVSWTSTIRNILPVSKCMDIRLSEMEARKHGPLGNAQSNTHWDMSIISEVSQCGIFYIQKGKV